MGIKSIFKKDIYYKAYIAGFREIICQNLGTDLTYQDKIN